ncbi:hypothetical protein M407DRAFT_25531 [Tulasnella calospora MUT 4182]|uniref:Retrotransposon gag domain-containing protein n=1 Tax=Tulasnella calospora MUT 4182 TaxID=1051891 RepID=A0A0C3KUC4_9AGAM|nr:hypothetical protein M407DRAFT_25531 [Tulasnella calospora MUT 4182]
MTQKLLKAPQVTPEPPGHNPQSSQNTQKQVEPNDHARIDITKCPCVTLKYLLNNFPKSEVSFTKSNLLVPYTPVTQAISRAYQVLPIDTVIEYNTFNLPRSTSSPNLISLNTPTIMGTQQGTTGVPSSTSTPGQPTQPMQPTQPIQQPTLPTIDPNILAAIIAALQVAGLGTQAPPQAQPKATKMKIKEPNTYDGKSRGGDAERWLLTCENYFLARASEFPDDVAKVQFALSYPSSTAQAWGDYILKDLLGAQLKNESHDWDSFKAVFVTAFGDPDKEGTAIRKLEALSQGSRPIATYMADFR